MAKVAREQWSSKLGFILAAAGSAVGLGNIWKFPYVAGESGGAAFILLYLLCIAIIALPVLLAEILIGRTTQRNPVGAFKQLSGKPFWVAVGGMGILAGFMILSFYAVVSGWSLGYIFEAITGKFYEFNEVGSSGAHFTDLTQSVVWNVGYFAVFMALTMLIVYYGVQKGIERGSKIMMPLLFILLIILMIRGLTLDGAEKGIDFLFNPDWSVITGKTVLVALGQAFFTLSLGMGAMLTYGSYMSKKDNIPISAVEIIILDTLVALVSGVVIFTAVFATGESPNVGPGLIFHTLPIVFTKMPGGIFFAVLFFILLSIAALTSAISLLEVVVAYFVDDKNWARHKAVIVFGFFTFLLGIPSALSFNVLADFKIFGLTFFGLMDYISSNILLPLGGLLISIFVGWVWGFDKAVPNLKQGAEKLFENYPWMLTLWKIFIRYFAPVLIFLVLLNALGLI